MTAHRDSNLDLLSHTAHDFDDALRCPCLPAVEFTRTEDGLNVVGDFTHDPIVARVLRVEKGHP